MYHLDKLYTVRDDDVTALRKDRASTPQRARPPSDGALLRKGLAAQLAREPHSIGGGSAHERTEFGGVPTSLGRIVIAYDRGDNSIVVHGVNVRTSELDQDLRQSLIATSAAFNAAFSAEEQTAQKIIIGLIVSEVMRRSEWLGTEVKRRLQAQRYDI